MLTFSYGKIVNMISAAALYGNFGQANYAAVKMAILGLNNVLKLEGIKYNISVNAVAPIAGTRMTREILPDELVNKLRPECTVPFIMQLCHESCNENGGIFEVRIVCVYGVSVVCRWEEDGSEN